MKHFNPATSSFPVSLLPLLSLFFANAVVYANPPSRQPPSSCPDPSESSVYSTLSTNYAVIKISGNSGLIYPVIDFMLYPVQYIQPQQPKPGSSSGDDADNDNPAPSPTQKNETYRIKTGTTFLLGVASPFPLQVVSASDAEVLHGPRDMRCWLITDGRGGIGGEREWEEGLVSVAGDAASGGEGSGSGSTTRKLVFGPGVKLSEGEGGGMESSSPVVEGVMGVRCKVILG